MKLPHFAGPGLTDVIQQANVLESAIQSKTDEELPDEFHQAVSEAQVLACIREAVHRALGLRLYDVQLMAGLAMMRGHIAEMATGEGKTLAASIPAAAGARAGKGVHVATVNAYLAKRDEEILHPVYERLGLESRYVPDTGSEEEKRAAYEADITYGTGYGFGFDFLRDRLQDLSLPKDVLGANWLRPLTRTLSPSEIARPVQRPFHLAVIDEMDSVLIDEAMTPLILSRPAPQGPNPAAPVYFEADKLATTLEPGLHVETLPPHRPPHLTRIGLQTVYEQRPPLPDALFQRAWHHYVETALQARLRFQRDVHYLVDEDRIDMIDPSTGRRFQDRKWRNGLHQAVEAKEGVTITYESNSDVSISRQQLYRLYPQLCGMTGTAWEARRELRRVYGLQVMRIPRNRPLQRVDLPPSQFQTLEAMFDEVVTDIRQQQQRRRPVLVGTRSLTISDRISERLHAEGIPHAVLNARQDAEEAERIAEAGQPGQVTVATNMAGRGADIPLAPGVAEAGGLHVIAVEWNDAARIDRQLAGRAGRQGDPGSTRCLASAADPLLADHPPGQAPTVQQLRRAQQKREQEAVRQRRAMIRHHLWLDKLKDHA